jgi:outer membrane protein, heavy metal efflux system
MSSTRYTCRYPLAYLGVLAYLLWTAVVWGQNQPLTRTTAINLALEHNPQIKTAFHAWHGERARARQAGSVPNPELELEFEEVPDLGSIGDFGERNIGIVQRFESPLKWWYRRQAGSQRAEASRLGIMETARLEVARRAGITYDRVILHQDVLRYARQNLELAHSVHRKAQIRFEAGDVPHLEVMRAEVEAGRALNRVALAKNDLAVAQAGLNSLMARPSSAPLVGADSLNYQPLTADLEQLKAMALRQRPDLAGARLHTSAQGSQHTAAAAAYVPDFNIGLYRQRLRGAAGSEDFWRLSLGLEIPLWAFGSQRATRAETRAASQQAKSEQETQRLRVLLETETAYWNLNTAQERVELFQGRILPQSQRAYTVGSRSYDEGKATYLDLLEAQRTLNQIQIEYAEALFEHRAAKAQLDWAIAAPLPQSTQLNK